MSVSEFTACHWGKTSMKIPLRCDAGISTRRTLMLGAVSVAAAMPLVLKLGTQSAATREDAHLRISDLVTEEGKPSRRTLELKGTRITLRGYAAPALRDGVLVDLYENTLALCPACGIVHDPGRSIAIVGADHDISWSGLRMTELTGIVIITADEEVRILI